MARSTIPPKERIIKAALREFSHYGYSGARVARIAKLAKVNARMPFYYFQSKQNLFVVVLESAWNEGRILEEEPLRPADAMVFWSRFYSSNREWSRLLAWEGLEWSKKEVIGERERRSFWLASIQKKLERAGPKGWPDSWNMPHLLLSAVAVAIVPVLLPQLSRLITGKSIDDPDFIRERTKFVREFGEFLANSPEAHSVPKVGTA